MGIDSELHDRLTRIEDAISVISTAIADIARLDQKHISTVEAMSRAFDEIKETKEEIRSISKRVTSIEIALPILNMTSTWVRAGVIGIISLVGISILALVLK
jgi:hypothetical protein